MKMLIKIFAFILFCILIYYFYFTRDGSLRLGLIREGISPFVYIENIDYENNERYLNQIEVNDKIIYLECFNYGPIKLARLYKFN